MKIIDLNGNWSVATAEGEHVCDLPFDVTASAVRDYSCSFGENSGYVPAATAVFSKTMPIVRRGRATLIVSGALGYGDVTLNGEKIGYIDSHAQKRFDVTDLLSSPHNTLKIELVSVPCMSDKYVGLGIGGGVKLVTEEEIDIVEGSLFVKTSTAGDKTYADVDVTVNNDSQTAAKLLLDCVATNARGKRCGKKQRKIFVRAGSAKTFTVRVRIVKAYEWTTSDPYMYGMTVKLIDAEGGEKSAFTKFGLVTRVLSSVRGLFFNGKNTKLFGAYVSHADAALGGASVYANERRRFEALKSIGYNAVHFVGCPTEAALDALDDIGMYAFVDLFDCLSSGKSPLDAHIFDSPRDVAAADSVLALRNHPCVAIYGVADDVPECYGRNGGHAEIKAIADCVRGLDTTRPVTVSSREFVPTAKELDAAGVKKRPEDDTAAINAGREKDLFGSLTEGAFSEVDVCGFNYLYPLYASDRAKYGRLILGSRSDPDRAFESVEETEKYPHVIGDFCDCGIDYPGGGLPGEILCTRGDLDAICDDKTRGVHKRIILGGRNIAHIAVLDPETEEPVAMWNWPRNLGRSVTVRVYTSGDVAALYLDGRLIGRKLAGKINNHIATFTTEYYPGTLEAVCYYKGVECARAKLKTAGSPKTIRLTAYDKNLSLSRGDVGFVMAEVCDRDGNIVPYAMRTLSATVEGAKVAAFINADPMLRKTDKESCPAYGGKALLVVKPDAEGKATVKITGDGLLASRISFKVKQ